MSGSLGPRLRESTLTVLRRYGVSEAELQAEEAEEGKPFHAQFSGHRLKITLTASSAAFSVRGGRWSGDRADYPSAGSFIADLEERLAKALSGQ